MQLVVGRISRPHGIRGEVSVEVRTDDPELRFKAGTALATEPSAVGPLTVGSRRWHSGRLLISFDGIADRDAADGLRGVLLVIDSDEVAGSSDPDEFHDHELIGLAVVTPGGDQVGTVTDVRHHGQDLLVVAGSGQRAGQEILIPFVSAMVPEVDVLAGRLVVDPPPGLLDPHEAD
jgi:16S rRNA processing protein RimM